MSCRFFCMKGTWKALNPDIRKILKNKEKKMSEYQLQIKQIVDYPRCRIYRQFIQSLMSDQSIRVGGGSGLFYFMVLCSYANFRTSYRRIDGISYTVYPGEWICTVKEVSGWFRTHLYWSFFIVLRKEVQTKCI